VYFEWQTNTFHADAFFTVQPAHGRGIWATTPVNACGASNRQVSRLRPWKGAASGLFPEYLKIPRSQKGIIEVILGLVRKC